MNQIQMDAPAFPVFCQLIAAFGQGAGTMMISAETMEAIAAEYWPVISARADFEPTLLQALEFARGLGRIAAQRALADGYNIVRVDDLRSAAEALRRQVHALGRCPYC